MDHDNVSANMAALTFQANINTMEVKGLEQLLSLSSPDVQRRFWNTMQAQSVLRSNFGVQLVEQGNKINNTQYTFTGLKEVYESMCLNLCGASHYPMTKLFGRSPAGMNATGESDLKNYYDYVDTLRESRLRPVLEKLLLFWPVPQASSWKMQTSASRRCGHQPQKRPPTLPKSRLTASLVRFSPACWMCPLHSRSCAA